MDYRIIKSDRVWDLTSDVNIMIEKGWKPIGGVSISCGGYGGASDMYAQAIIKE